MNFSGLLLIDKEAGLTSHDVVARARKILGTRAIGHAGTLDPIATGLLVLLVGEATKLSDFVVEGFKRYRVRVGLGVTTNTLDCEGEVVNRCEVGLLQPAQITEAISELSGVIKLPVPHFSAVKVAGQKLYDLARAGTEVTVPIRDMHFFDIELKEQGADWLEVELSCAKGGYVRAWAHRLGELLGVGGHVAALRRLKIHPFGISEAITLEQLGQVVSEKGHGSMAKAIIPMSEALPLWKSFRVYGKEESLMRHGQIPRPLAQRIHLWRRENEEKSFGVRVLSGSSGNLMSLLTFKEGSRLAVQRIFNSVANELV